MNYLISDTIYKKIHDSILEGEKKSVFHSFELFLGCADDPIIIDYQKILSNLEKEGIIVERKLKKYNLLSDYHRIPDFTRNDINSYSFGADKKQYTTNDCSVELLRINIKKFDTFLKQIFEPKTDFLIDHLKYYSDLTEIIKKGLSDDIPDQKLNQKYLTTARNILRHLDDTKLDIPIEIYTYEPPFADLYTAKSKLIKTNSSKEVEIKKIEANRDRIMHHVDFYNITGKKIETKPSIDDQLEKTSDNEIIKPLKFEASILHFANKEINFNRAPYQRDLLNTLFKEPGQRWNKDQILDDWDDKELQSRKSTIRTACYGIRRNIITQTGINDFLIINKTFVQINPKYLPKSIYE